MITGSCIAAASTSMNVISSVFSRGLNFSNFMGSFATVGNFIINAVSRIVGFLYCIFKWVLYFIDIIFAYVQQLCGLNMDLSSLEAAMSGDSDLIFNFLWAQSEYITRIVRALIILAVILIVIFSIFAVIKTQFESLTEGKPADIGMVIRNMLKSFVLLIITPLAAILGIVASDVILQSLYKATSVSECASLSTQIFMASATSANSYRLYGENGKRIPVVYNFENQKKILEYYSDKDTSLPFVEFLTSTKNAIYTTYLSFETENFIPFSSLREEEAAEAYYSIYDVTPAAFGDNFAEYRRIDTHYPEYLVMADVVEFCMRSTTSVYYKTIEDVLYSISDIPNTDLANVELKNVIENFGLEFFSTTNNQITALGGRYKDLVTKIRDGQISRIEYRSRYYNVDDSGEPARAEEYTYSHLCGETDEVNGAKYIIAAQRSVVGADGVEYDYYYPLTTGTKGEYNINFESQFIAPGQAISAKGVFESGKYPTAVKQDNEGNIVFYRDKIEDCYTGEFGNLANLSYETEDGGMFGKLTTFFKSLFNPASVIPRLDLDPEAISATYTSNLTTVNTLKAGKLHIGYMFSDWLTTGLLKGNFTLNIENLFQPLKINYLMLICCALLLLKVVFTAMITLMNRLFELFLVIIFYPTACATIPLTNEGYRAWFSSYFNRLLSTYGIILGINFIFVLMPVISTIEVFDAPAIAKRKFLRKFSGLFFGATNYTQMASMLNFGVVILFEIVLFTFIKNIPEIIDNLTGGKNGSERNDPLGALAAGIANATAAGKVIKVVTGKPLGFAKNVLTASGRQKIKDNLLKAVPMSGYIQKGKDMHYLRGEKKKQKEAEKEFKSVLNDPKNYDTKEGKELIQKKMNEMLKAQESYNKALSDPHRARVKDDIKRKEEIKAGVSSRGDDDLTENNIDVSKLTTKDVKKRYKKSKKIVKYLEKKQKKGILTAEEEKAYRTYTKVKEDTAGVKKDRKHETKESRKMNASSRKAASQTVKEESKTNRKIAKESAKDEKRIQKENQKFQKTGIGSGRGQNKVLNKYQERNQEIEKGLYKVGYNASQLSTMTDAELNDQIVHASKYGNTADQVTLLQEYQKNKTRQQELMGINTTQISNKQEMKTIRQRYSDNQIAGYHGHNLNRNATVRRRTRQSLDTTDDELELQKIQAEMETLRAGGMTSNKDKNRYRRLSGQAARAQSNIDQANNWNDMNTSEHYDQVQQEKERYRRGRNNYRQSTEEDWEKHGSYNADRIQRRAVRNTQNRRNRRH